MFVDEGRGLANPGICTWNQLEAADAGLQQGLPGHVLIMIQ